MRIGDLVRHNKINDIPAHKMVLFDAFKGQPLNFAVERVLQHSGKTFICFKETAEAEWEADNFEILVYLNAGDRMERMFKGDGQYGNSMLAYQLFTDEWVNVTFKDCKNADGEDVITSLNERNYRVFEESCELVQSGGMTREQMHAIVDMVCDKPVEPKIEKEVGGLLSTLAAFCNARSIDMWKCAVEGLKRNWEHIDAIRDRQKNKPAMKDKSGMINAITLDPAKTTTPTNAFRWATTEDSIGNVTSHELQQCFLQNGVTPVWKPIPTVKLPGTHFGAKR